MRPPSSIIQKLILSSREHGRIVLDQTNDAAGAEGIVTATATGKFGTVYLREILDDGYSVRYGCIQVVQNVNLISILDVSYVGLFINLGAAIPYSQEGIKPGAFKKGHCTLVSIPYLHMKTKLLSRRSYSFLDIAFAEEYLRKWERTFPSTRKLLKMARKGMSLLETFPIPARHSRTIDSIINMGKNLNDRAASEHIRSGINELLFILFDHYERTASALILKPEDIQKFQEVRDLLIQNPETRISLKKLSQHTGMNEFKLKHGFKKVFGLPVYKFHFEERMKKAKQMLEKGDRPINEIAIIVGYKNLSSFSAAFKKRFGYPPSSIK